MPLNGNPPTYAIFVNNCGVALAPWQLLNFMNHNAALTQNIKRTLNSLFGSHLKYIKSHGFPFHFVNERYITGIFRFAYGEKILAVNR